MAKKTAVKQLIKWLPLSAELRAAATLDGAVRTDAGPLIDADAAFIDGEVDDTAPAITAAEQTGDADYGDLLDAAAAEAGR